MMKTLFSNLKMFYKLLVSPIVVVLLLTMVVFLSYKGFAKQHGLTYDIYNNRFGNYRESAKIIMELTNVHANLYKIIGWANANFPESKIDEFAKEQWSTLQRNVAFMKDAVVSERMNGEEKECYKKALAETIKYHAWVPQVVDSAKADGATASLLMNQADDLFQVLNKNLQDLMNLENRLSKEKYDESVAGFSSLVKGFIGVSVAAIFIALFLSVTVAKLVTGPIRQAMAVVRKIAEGDLTQEIAMSSRDEIGELAGSVNVMREKMSEAVGQSVINSQRLSEACSEQAASLEETSSSLEQMSSMIRQNAANTAQANELMVRAGNVTEQANGSMGQLTQSMKEIAQASEQTQKIVKTIDEIAFQTNLLALNAAVEAARAGEAGAGFAVVAGEVRNLAMRAAEAAKNTSSLMEDIVGKVKNGDRLVDETNTAFHHMNDSSVKVVELMKEIAAASTEQSEGIEQVNKAVAEMNVVTQQNAASAEEMASIMALFKTNHQSAGRVSPVKIAERAVRARAVVKSGRFLPAPPQ